MSRLSILGANERPLVGSDEPNRWGRTIREEPMNSWQRSPITVAAEAVSLAEDALAPLPMSAYVRDLHRRVAALKSILHGVARDILTAEQRRRLAKDAMALASEVSDCRSRAAGSFRPCGVGTGLDYGRSGRDGVG